MPVLRGLLNGSFNVLRVRMDTPTYSPVCRLSKCESTQSCTISHLDNNTTLPGSRFACILIRSASSSSFIYLVINLLVYLLANLLTYLLKYYLILHSHLILCSITFMTCFYHYLTFLFDGLLNLMLTLLLNSSPTDLLAYIAPYLLV